MATNLELDDIMKDGQFYKNRKSPRKPSGKSREGQTRKKQQTFR